MPAGVSPHAPFLASHSPSHSQEDRVPTVVVEEEDEEKEEEGEEKERGKKQGWRGVINHRKEKEKQCFIQMCSPLLSLSYHMKP